MRKAMTYNASEHGTTDKNECPVRMETERFLKTTTRSGSAILRAARNTLAANNVHSPGTLPAQYADLLAAGTMQHEERDA